VVKFVMSLMNSANICYEPSWETLAVMSCVTIGIEQGWANIFYKELH